MKYMGWSWNDLMMAPSELVNEVIRVINDEAVRADDDRLMAELRAMSANRT